MATMLEPLSVATHAVKRAGSLAGKSVLVLGAGTVGQLVLLVARAMGAASIAVTDVRQEALDLAAAQGADHVSVERFMPRRPFVLGHELAGQIVGVQIGFALVNVLDPQTQAQVSAR